VPQPGTLGRPRLLAPFAGPPGALVGACLSVTQLSVACCHAKHHLSAALHVLPRWLSPTSPPWRRRPRPTTPRTRRAADPLPPGTPRAGQRQRRWVGRWRRRRACCRSSRRCLGTALRWRRKRRLRWSCLLRWDPGGRCGRARNAAEEAAGGKQGRDPAGVRAGRVRAGTASCGRSSQGRAAAGCAGRLAARGAVLCTGRAPRDGLILFYSILFYSILFYSILFYSILFYSILFYSIASGSAAAPQPPTPEPHVPPRPLQTPCLSQHLGGPHCVLISFFLSFCHSVAELRPCVVLVEVRGAAAGGATHGRFANSSTPSRALHLPTPTAVYWVDPRFAEAACARSSSQLPIATCLPPHQVRGAAFFEPGAAAGDGGPPPATACLLVDEPGVAEELKVGGRAIALIKLRVACMIAVGSGVMRRAWQGN
jgi:hypothetical protein